MAQTPPDNKNTEELMGRTFVRSLTGHSEGGVPNSDFTTNPRDGVRSGGGPQARNIALKKAEEKAKAEKKAEEARAQMEALKENGKN